jgi:hypothetical protein
MAWLLQRISAPNAASLSVMLLGLFMLQTVALTFSPILFIQQDFRSIAKYSIATHSRVCYVLPATMKTPPQHIFAFYVSRLYGHPELSPEQKSLAAVPPDPAGADCPLWAEATLEKRGSTVLGALPQFSHCFDVPLSPSRPHAASELWDCRGPAAATP